MTDDDLSELRRKAEAATPGPWLTEDDLPINVKPRIYNENFLVAEVGNVQTERQDQWERDAAYIAAANPAVTLAMLDEIEKLRFRIAWLEK